MGRLLRYLWAGPTTCIGIGLAVASLRRGHVAIVDGVIEAHSPFLRRALASLTPLAGGADAMTLGHVVIGRDARALEATRAHERAHVRQYELWGPLSYPYTFWPASTPSSRAATRILIIDSNARRCRLNATGTCVDAAGGAFAIKVPLPAENLR